MCQRYGVSPTISLVLAGTDAPRPLAFLVVTDRELHLHVRISRDERDEIDKQAAEMGENRSEWVLRTLRDALRRYTPGRRIVVQRERSRRLTPQRLCSHPAQLCSEPNPVTGERRCLACDSTIVPVR
jgi:uncharacterized protein (DUF1778 family)